MTMTTKTTRYQFITAVEEPRLVLATGHMRRPPLGDPDGLQVQLATRGAAMAIDVPLMVVNLRRAAWLDGCRYLAANGVLPIAEMALPSAELPEDADPGKLADTYARQQTEHAMQGGLIEAPENHAIWGHLRRFTGQGFIVGWFAARRGTAAIVDYARELKRVAGSHAHRSVAERDAMEELFRALVRFEQ
jgi:hypothetical protein